MDPTATPANPATNPIPAAASALFTRTPMMMPAATGPTSVRAKPVAPGIPEPGRNASNMTEDAPNIAIPAASAITYLSRADPPPSRSGSASRAGRPRNGPCLPPDRPVSHEPPPRWEGPGDLSRKSSFLEVAPGDQSINKQTESSDSSDPRQCKEPNRSRPVEREEVPGWSEPGKGAALGISISPTAMDRHRVVLIPSWQGIGNSVI